MRASDPGPSVGNMGVWPRNAAAIVVAMFFYMLAWLIRSDKEP